MEVVYCVGILGKRDCSKENDIEYEKGGSEEPPRVCDYFDCSALPSPCASMLEIKSCLLWTSHFEYMFLMWVLRVLGAMNSVSSISELSFPEIIISAISCSLWERR